MQQAELDDDVSPEASPEPQTQRRRTQHDDDDDDEDEAFAGDHGITQSSGTDDMAKKLVRLALACEYQRKPIRRQEISEKVLGTNGRSFKEVFGKAQLQLEEVFGMRMVELPAREKVTLQQRRAAQKKDSQAAKAVTTWTLSTTLPNQYRVPLHFDEHEQQSGFIQPSSAPTPATEAQYTAIYTTLVALILFSGGQLPDAKMERYLRKLHLDDQTPLPEQKKNEQLMKRLEKDGYIYRIKEATGTGEDDVYWVVGPRGRVEVGDEGARGLALAVYDDEVQTDEQEAELEQKIQRSLGIAENELSAAVNKQKGNGEPKRRRRRQEAEEEEEEDDDGDDEE